MNSGLTECNTCGCDPCKCKEIKKEKEIREEKESRRKVIYLWKTFDKQTTELYQALVALKGFRLRILRWLYPEIEELTDTLRECYWLKQNLQGGKEGDKE